MTVLLAGDIGGTKTILRLVISDQPEARKVPLLTTLYEKTYASGDFPDLVPMVRRFMAEAKGQLGEVPAPEKACFGIAGPVVNNTSKLTNLSWHLLDAEKLQKELHIPQVKLINDFVAVGYGVLGLSPNDLHTLKPGQPDPDAPIAIIGAGTGLGEGYVIPCGGGYRVFGAEGGHADFAPRSPLEVELMDYLKEQGDLERVSVERVVSGMGIENIYQFLRDRQYAAESPTLTAVFTIWKQEIGREEKSVDLAATISRHAQENSDYLCQATMELFASAYGAEAGNLALKLLPNGGLYVAGGIAAKNLSLMQQGEFLQAFSAKGRVSSVLEKVPVHIVLNTHVGLIGAAICAAQL
ncbi:glucokinase [Kovacikia minuta CCNUW1]|uniref:glucokinase n=1 Tax=Kovacikia minuta TaxID=2931930 RepID=UPI001CCBD3FF|nr:glucokinase [Kovacikia minuta]UBF24208.1 glucokinase [Kovacikia minuta CCNUW1]